MEAEFRYLHNPEKPKTLEVVTHWVVSWENRITMMQAMDAQYQMSEQSKKNTAYGCMPTELQKVLDQEQAKGNLFGWTAMKDFIITFIVVT